MKCYDVATQYYTVLEYNMQVMCNWMWCIIVEMYSMTVDYVLSISIVDYNFTIIDYNLIIVDYNFTLVDYIFTAVDYKLIWVENITSFSRKYNII